MTATNNKTRFKNPVNILIDLLDPKKGVLHSVFAGLAISVGPALLISAALYYILGDSDAPLPKGDFLVSLFEIGLIAPLFETLLMWPILKGLMYIAQQNKALVALLSAALWAGIHGAFSASWGLTIFWPFLIFTVIFLNWRPLGLIYALGVTTVVHALQNILAILYIHFG